MELTDNILWLLKLINGGIETGLGLSLLNTTTRRAAQVATIAYVNPPRGVDVQSGRGAR